jgi:transcription elongation factor Elf1
MAITLPKSMAEVYYHTIRANPDGSKIRAWAFKKTCPECGKGRLSKPLNEKTGKYKIRSTEFECTECKHTVSKEEAEEGVMLEATYTCPHCQKEGESEAPYKRKSFKGVKSYIIECEHCGEKIPVTKKMKTPKPKKPKK